MLNKTYNAITSVKWCTHIIRFFLAIEPLQAGLQQNLTNLARNFVFLLKSLANCKRNACADTIVQESYKLVLTCMISCKSCNHARYLQYIILYMHARIIQLKNLARIMQDLLQGFCKIHKDILHALLHTFIVAMETTSSTHLLSLNLDINSTRK